MKFTPHPAITLRKFPTRAVVIYLAAHIFAGLIVAILSVGDYEFPRHFFISIDAALPTFRTWFVHSKDPLGCKVMLLLWWVFFLPWGTILFGLFTSGFTISNAQVFASPWSRVQFLIIGVFFTALFLYGHSLMDHSGFLASASQKSGRSSVIPSAISLGPEYFAIYLAGASLLTVVALGVVLMLLRQQVHKK